MKTTTTGALAFLLLAGVSTAALAQDREHDHDHGGGNAQPQVHQGGPHGGPGGPGAPAQTPPAGVPQAAPAPPAGQPFQGHNPRFGAPTAPGVAPQFDRGGQRFREGAPNGERFGRDAGPGGDRHFDGEHRFQGGGQPHDGATPGDRRWDRPGAPNVVIPPGAGERGGDRQHDGHQAGNPNWRPDGRGDGRGDGRFDGRRDGRGDNRWDGRGDSRWDGRGAPHWGRGEHWERGRLPPVFWSQNRYRLGAYRAPYGYYVRDWGYGDFLPRGWYGDSYFLGDFLDYDLPYPPPGYEWVRVGADAVMVDRYTGRVVQVVRGIFW
jgi:Ni/Co efflux regulator RcnB